MTLRYNSKNIRNLLIEGFTPEELRQLCYDVPVFRPVYHKLAQNTGKEEISHLLIEYAEQKRLVGTLLDEAKSRNPAAYEKYQPYEAQQQEVQSKQREKHFHLFVFVLGTLTLGVLIFIASKTDILGYFTSPFSPTPFYTPISTSTIQPNPLWELSYDSPSYQIRDLAVYNGKLYAAGLDYGLKNGKLYEYDNLEECSNRPWKDITGKFGATIDAVESLQIFNDKLYIGTLVDKGDEKEARVYYYNGKDITLDFSANGTPGNSGFVDFVAHNKVLYSANEAAYPDGGVYQRNNDHDWGKIITGSVRALASYDGNLYAGSWQSTVWLWTGVKPKLVKDFNDGQFYIKELDSVWSLETFNNKLYVGLGGSTADTVFIPAFDGKDWKPVGEEIDSSGYTKLIVIDHNLWMIADRGQVFILEGVDWKKLPTISEPNADGVQALALYNNFLYAGTFTEGRIYCFPYSK